MDTSTTESTYSRRVCHILHTQFCRRGSRIVSSDSLDLLRGLLVDFSVETKTHLKVKILIKKRLSTRAVRRAPGYRGTLRYLGRPTRCLQRNGPETAQDAYSTCIQCLGRPPTYYELALKACPRDRGRLPVLNYSDYMGNSAASYIGVS